MLNKIYDSSHQYKRLLDPSSLLLWNGEPKSQMLVGLTYSYSKNKNLSAIPCSAAASKTYWYIQASELGLAIRALCIKRDLFATYANVTNRIGEGVTMM